MSSERQAGAAQPLIDVLLATFNGARYLPDQLDSLLAQTYTNFRLLVSDDGSSDTTLAVLARYAPRFHGRLIVVAHPGRGGGVVKNFENLMATSLRDGVARWIAFADQDDVWLPHKIERCAEEMRPLEEACGTGLPCLVHSDLAVVDENLRPIADSFAQYQHMDPQQCSPLSLLSVNQVTGCTMLVNRALLEVALPLPPETVMHDWWCALLSGSGRRRFIDEPLILYRQHGSNQLGAKDRSLGTRLWRLLTNGRGVVQRVRALGMATHLQAQALQARLQRSGQDEAYVSEYLAWRAQPLWTRLWVYRRYYAGPELDRLSRCLLWFK